MSLWIRLCNHTYIHTYIHPNSSAAPVLQQPYLSLNTGTTTRAAYDTRMFTVQSSAEPSNLAVKLTASHAHDACAVCSTVA